MKSHSADNPSGKDQAEHCRKSGPIEICKEISGNGVRTSMNGPSVEFQNDVGGVKVEFAQGKANAYATTNTIDIGWGLSFVKVSGNLYMPVFDLGDKRIEMNVGLAVGVGGGEGIVFARSSNEQHIEFHKPTEISTGHTQQKNKETYQGSATYTPFPGIPVTGSIEVTIIDKKDLSRTTTNMPAEFGALILEKMQFDLFTQGKQAQTVFTDFLKSKNIKFATEDELRQFAKEEAEKFKKGEGDIYKYVTDAAVNAKKIKNLVKHDDLAQAEQIFGELSKPFQIAGAVHFFAGNNRVANKFFGAAQTVSNMPKMAETVSKSFAMAGGLFSGKIALSMGSIASAGLGVLSGIGTISAAISIAASLFGGNNDAMEEFQEGVMAYFQHLDNKMDVVIKIGNETLVISHKIYEAVKNNFFAQQLNHQEVVALLVEHFMKIHEQSSSAHSLLGQSYSLISDESAELRSMLQEERYAAIQKMHDVVMSKLARKLATFNDFLEKEFDTLYHEARIANAGNTLTAGNKPCNLENMNSLLAHFKDIRRFRAPDDFYTVFNVINLIQECATNPKLDGASLSLQWNITKLNNLIGIYIQVDTLAKIIERLKKEKQNIREMLPEIDKQINYAEEQVAKISEFLNRLSADIKRVEEALVKVQVQAREDATRFHENAQSQIAHSNAPLVLKEKLAVENELSWGRTHYAYPDLWKKPGLTHEENMQLSHYEPHVTVPPMDEATWESTVDGVVGQMFHGVHFLGIKMQAIAWSDQGLLAKFMETCKQTPRITTDNHCDTAQIHHLRFFDEHRSPCAMPYGNPYNYPCKPTFLTPLQATHDFEKFVLSTHNSELYQELRQLSMKDLAQEQKLYFEQLHQQNMQLLEQPSSSDKPLLRHILPAKSYNDGKGIALRVPNWLLSILKNEILAEQLGIGHLELFYNGDKKNQFIVDVEFVFKKDNSRLKLYQFSDQLDKYVCANTNYQQMDRIAYYWYGGVYCSPSVQRKISYLAISSPYLFHSIYDATFEHRARTDKRIFKTINFPLYRHHPDHWSMSTMPEDAVLAKMPQYENHQVIIEQAIKQQQIANRNALNTHMRDNIVQKQSLGQALDYFEFNLRMQHHILMMKAPVPSTAKSLHEKLLQIAQQCDREASLDFIDRYQGEGEYLESRYQTCVTALKALDAEVATIPKTGNYLLKQTQGKISALKTELQSPDKTQVEQMKQQIQENSNQHTRLEFEPQNNGGFKPSPAPENRSRRNIDDIRKAAGQLDLAGKMDAYMERWEKDESTANHEESIARRRECELQNEAFFEVEEPSNSAPISTTLPVTSSQRITGWMRSFKHSAYSFVNNIKMKFSQNTTAAAEPKNPDTASKGTCSANQAEDEVLYDNGICEQTNDSDTQEPVWDCTALKRGQEVGKLKLYGQPIHCFSEDGQKSNVLENTGIFDQSLVQNGEVCRVLPPTTEERAVLQRAIFIGDMQSSIQSGSGHGFLRGCANLFEKFLQHKMRMSTNLAYITSQGTYYTSLFAIRFCSRRNNIHDVAGCLNEIYLSAFETGQILIVNTALSLITKLLNSGSKMAAPSSWNRTVLEKSSQVVQFGVFAFNASKTGLATTAASIAAGSLTQTVTEQVGARYIKKARLN